MASGEGKKALTERERRIWRAGYIAGVDAAIDAAAVAADLFKLRVKVRGVKADPPADFSLEHPAERWRRHG